MAGRTTWRIPIRMNVTLNSQGKTCAGTVINLSESGMFITVGDSGFKRDEQFDVTIPVKEGMLHVPGKIVRESKVNEGFNGIGIKLLDPPENYLSFVENLLFVL